MSLSCCSGLLVSFLYFRTTAKVDVNKITNMTGLKHNILEFIGLIIYRFLRYIDRFSCPMAAFLKLQS